MYTNRVLERIKTSVAGAVLFGPLACGFTGSVQHPAPKVHLNAAEAAVAWAKAQNVIETRCVVCHGCYDAPCQLKLGTFEGIARGASEAKVYDGARLLAVTPTRLEVDAHDTLTWRKKGFHPVLPEGDQADPRTSLLMQMLELKRKHPLTSASDIAKDFTLELDRKQTCTRAEDFGSYAKEHPLWGMPYGLPGLDLEEQAVVGNWVNAGAPNLPPVKLTAPIETSLEHWESFLNEPSLKSQLIGRYLYEHLFLASLYFKGVADDIFFRLVRSRTPSGVALDEIPTRRPFDDPEVKRVYYRFVRRVDRPLEKTHMPYPLSDSRLSHFRELFVKPKYAVDRLPSYEPKIAANPFRAFQLIPAQARYRFMLEEAEFTMMGFIKGPVCRGQVALNVIEDRFWITFYSPDVPWMNEETAFLADVKQDLDMPAEDGSTVLPTLWLQFGAAHERYVKKKAEFLEKVTKAGDDVTLRLIWDGDGQNSNAALTVFRHFDSATVVKGLVGTAPKTAWVVGYPLLERIHYLLVAGFDVFGNIAHQGTTRLYMDFLRLEGEANFLTFLPPSSRTGLVDTWYRGVDGAAKERIKTELMLSSSPNIRYQTRDAKEELFTLLKAHVGPVLLHGFDWQKVEDRSLHSGLERLQHVLGHAATWMPETSFVTVQTAAGPSTHLTILRDSAHSNVTHLFNEDDRRLKEEDALSVVRGFLGAYPNALFNVQRKDFDAFVDAVGQLDSAGAYRALRTRFGVLRTSDGFWNYSDRIHAEHRKEAVIQSGLFDYNRLEAY